MDEKEQVEFVFNWTPVIFPIFWITVLFILSRAGWNKLSTQYSLPYSSEEFEKKNSISCGVNNVNYRGAITLYQNKKGFSMKPWFLFRLFHPQIYIPWSEIKQIKRKKTLGFTTIELEIGTPEVATLKFYEVYFKKLDIPEDIKNAAMN